MSLFDFTMPDGSAGADPSTLSDYSSGGTDSTTFSTLYGVSDGSPGAGYNWATGTDALPQSASSQTLGQLQSGGSTIDWNTILQGGLTALVAADSISHGLTASGQALPTYKAPNGYVYPVGQGPATRYQSGGGFMMLLLVGVVLFALAEEK
ncbi:hypothetical protein [Burkholderia cepacia]|uniref:hypothetical protein n=1 Tax=Burkholderia cepacia TaxID=292 RepID=UPI001CF19DC9|nr:hypothetical protein [Burkholderia cepacia]MCA8115678.1 hypothetical protein [Burkholderia cepacia]MCA8402765.1 hypothetical protein [Burkholderia cepacia]